MRVSQKPAETINPSFPGLNLLYFLFILDRNILQYGGSVSDRGIAERSQLPQSCDPGDSVMADKGFNVQDLFIPYNVIINIPTFFKKKNRLSGQTVLNDRKIASKRVHIKRIIGLAKTYNSHHSNE